MTDSFVRNRYFRKQRTLQMIHFNCYQNGLSLHVRACSSALPSHLRKGVCLHVRVCVCVRSWRRVVCGTGIMTSIFTFMKYQGHGSKLSLSFKMAKLVVLKAEVSKSVYPFL